MFGFNPDTGVLLWSSPHEAQYGLNVSTPAWWAGGNILFVASAYGVGAHGIELYQAAGKTTVKQLWYDPHLELHWGPAIVRDGYVYISSGYNGPALMSAVVAQERQDRVAKSWIRQGAIVVGRRQGDHRR